MFFFDRMFHEKLFAFFYLNKIFFVVDKISKRLVLYGFINEKYW